MPRSKIITQEKQAAPISNRQQIEDKLEEVLAELKPIFGEKKYKRRIKEAGKVIGSGLKKRLKTDKNNVKIISSTSMDT